ncbi:MAG: hypothetical protein ACPG31_05055 [Planctomycetota bacterium]
MTDPLDSSLTSRLQALAAFPTGTTSAGYPYLSKAAWRILRDEVPILFGAGARVLEVVDALTTAADALPAEDAERQRNAMRVVRQVVQTAAITAPPDLWLMRNILSAFATLGLHHRLLAGESIVPEACEVDGKALNEDVLTTDLGFLHARGLVELYDDGYRIAGHPTAHAVWQAAKPLPEGLPASTTRWWRNLFSGVSSDPQRAARLRALGEDLQVREEEVQTHWLATPSEIELGFRLLPVVLGLRATEMTSEFMEGTRISTADWPHAKEGAVASGLRILAAAGWIASLERDKEHPVYAVTALGARGFSRGPGPFGIIETYQAYLDQGVLLLQQGTADVWVERGENVGASQDANRRAFESANDALDRFCDDTGFIYKVFVEHAVGRGEATRIRHERSGDAGIHYFGADLEDAAIDEAKREQERGVLPSNMQFVRRADIGRPDILKAAFTEAAVDTQGAVMMVGNGFHEVREQDFTSMTEVLRGYEQMGMVLLFTEENALSVEDLRNTAWNTYHAGFKYVHDLSGQVLRPGVARTPHRSGHLMRAAWEECALAAGYVRADKYCSRTRTIYPYPTKDGHNPAVSRNHFFVPGAIAKQLKGGDEEWAE